VDADLGNVPTLRSVTSLTSRREKVRDAVAIMLEQLAAPAP
jgi:hypothetical protein